MISDAGDMIDHKSDTRLQNNFEVFFSQNVWIPLQGSNTLKLDTIRIVATFNTTHSCHMTKAFVDGPLTQKSYN